MNSPVLFVREVRPRVCDAWRIDAGPGSREVASKVIAYHLPQGGEVQIEMIPKELVSKATEADEGEEIIRIAENRLLVRIGLLGCSEAAVNDSPLILIDREAFETSIQKCVVKLAVTTLGQTADFLSYRQFLAAVVERMGWAKVLQRIDDLARATPIGMGSILPGITRHSTPGVLEIVQMIDEGLAIANWHSQSNSARLQRGEEITRRSQWIEIGRSFAHECLVASVFDLN